MRDERFEIGYTDQALKDLKRLRPWTEQAFNAILQLRDEPSRGHFLTGNLRGCRSLEFSLKGSGVSRAVYVVTEEKRIRLVFLVGPHENVDDRAERRVAALRRSGQL